MTPKQTRPFLTVMIPVYNGENYLSEALESVLHQPCDDLEALVLDDGSSDSTSAICQRYQRTDRRVHVVRHTNMGLGRNRNEGISHVHGSWIAFLDHDDVMVPGLYTPELKQTLQQCGEKHVEMIVNGRLLADASLQNPRLQKLPEGGVFQYGSKQSWRIPYEFSTCLYSVDLINRYHIQFSTTRPEMESIFRHKCAFLAQRLMFVPNGFIEIRREHGSQITQNWNQQQVLAIRMAEYAQLPVWHKEHESYTNSGHSSVKSAYKILSEVILEYFFSAIKHNISFEKMTYALQKGLVSSEVISLNKDYSISANLCIWAYQKRSRPAILLSTVVGLSLRKISRMISPYDHPALPLSAQNIKNTIDQYPQILKKYLKDIRVK